MSIAQNFPNIKPSLMLSFADTKQLDSRITYTRASTASYYDGVTTSKAEENLFTYSQEFDNAAWLKTNATVTANSTAAPDGTTTADTLFETTTNGQHRVFVSPTVTGTYTISAYAKAAGRDYVALWFGGVDKGKFFYIPAGGSGSVGNNFVNAPDSSSITYVGNDWYRCTVTVSGLSGSAQHINACLDATTFSYAGDVTKGVHIWGAQLEQRSAVTAYTATTTQAITNYIPKLQSAASGVARFDNNPTTGESLGLLIEESRTNLQLNSELLTSNWSATRTNISSTTIVAPNGALTGSKLYTDSTASNTHFLTQSGYFITATGTITFSVYAKAAELSKIGLREGANTGSYATFNLTTGAVISSAGTGVVAAITSVGNGWYRVAMTLTNTGNSTFEIYLLPNSYTSGGPTVSFNGDGWSGLYIWGAQSENGAFATSYIPTVASQVTRAADAASMTGTNFSSWYRQGESTIYADFVLNGQDSGHGAGIVSLFYNSSSNGLLLFRNTANSTFLAYVDSTSASIGTITVGSSYKTAFAYNGSSNGAVLNAGTVSSVGTSLSQQPIQMNIFADSSGGQKPTGTIKKIAYYPLRVTNAQLQALTS